MTLNDATKQIYEQMRGILKTHSWESKLAAHETAQAMDTIAMHLTIDHWWVAIELNERWWAVCLLTKPEHRPTDA